MVGVEVGEQGKVLELLVAAVRHVVAQTAVEGGGPEST